MLNVETMDASLDSLSAFLAFEAAAAAAAIVGAVGMLLAVLGVYGVMSYTAVLRRREVGIRLALGARPGRVLRLMLGRGAVVVACGLGAGLGLAVAAARLSANLLAGIRFTDPAAYAGAGLLLGVVSLLACALPARRVTRLDPVRTLRQE